MPTYPSTKRNNPSLAARLDALESQGVGVSLAIDQAPATGAIDGANKTFTVSYGSYVPGSLKVYLNTTVQVHTNDFVETNPATGTFDMVDAPDVGDTIRVEYQKVTSSTGNADTLDGYHANPTATPGMVLPLDGAGDLLMANNAKYSWKNLAGSKDGYIKEDTNENIVHNIATGKKHSFMVNGVEVFKIDGNGHYIGESLIVEASKTVTQAQSLTTTFFTISNIADEDSGWIEVRVGGNLPADRVFTGAAWGWYKTGGTMNISAGSTTFISINATSPNVVGSVVGSSGTILVKVVTAGFGAGNFKGNVHVRCGSLSSGMIIA